MSKDASNTPALLRRSNRFQTPFQGPKRSANPPKRNIVDMSGKVVQQEPLAPTTLGFWSSIGIQKGKAFAPDERI